MQTIYDNLYKIIRNANGASTTEDALRGKYEIRNLLKSGKVVENVFIDLVESASRDYLTKMWSSFRLFNEECRGRFPVENKQVSEFIMKDFVEKNKNNYNSFEKLFLKFIRMKNPIKFMMIVPPSSTPLHETTQETTFIIIGINKHFTTVNMNAIFNGSNKTIVSYNSVHYSF